MAVHTRWILRGAILLVLVGNGVALAIVAAGLAERAPGWVAQHYAPRRADTCAAMAARVRATVRHAHAREPTPEEEGRIAEVVEAGHCATEDPEVRALEEALGILDPRRAGG
ncbi:MAG: hypothetical protein FJ090_20815 [Deltaproteobacteria bacterium]|nr:hypothetical protein [Deltaproteobacteria bacterium]